MKNIKENQLTVKGMSAELVTSGLAREKAEKLIKEYGLPMNEIGEMITESLSIEVKSDNETDKMERARRLRLDLRKNRTALKKRHDEIKSEILPYSKAVDLVYRRAEEMIKPVEAHLQLQEDYIELKQKAIKDKLEAERKEKLAKYGDNDLSIYNLGIMTEEGFQALEIGLKKIAEDKLEAERKAKELEERELKEMQERAEKAEKLNKRITKLSELGFIAIADNKLSFKNKAVVDKEVVYKFDDKDFDKFFIKVKEKVGIIIKEEEAEAKKLADEQAKIKEQAEKARKLEAEIEEKARAEAQAEAERKKAEAQAQAKPEKDKINDYIHAVFNTEKPEINDPKLNELLNSKIHKILANACNQMMQELKELEK